MLNRRAMNNLLFAQVGMALLLFAGSSALAGQQQQFQISAQSDREEYIAGMAATFTVTLTDARGRAVNMQSRYLYATFPSAQAQVTLSPVNSIAWRYSAATSLVGQNALHVELRRDNRAQVLRTQQNIASYQQQVVDVQAQIVRYQQLRDQATLPWLKRLYDVMIRVCQIQIQVVQQLIVLSEQSIAQMETPLISADKAVTVYAQPQPLVTAPAADAALRGQIQVEAALGWARGASVTLFVDAAAKETKTIAGDIASFSVDTSAYADAAHLFAVEVAPTGYPVVFRSPEVSARFDNTPPVIGAVAPGADALIADSKPLVSCAYADAFTGVNAASAHLTLDGADVTAQATTTAQGLEYRPADAIAEGQHSVAISIADVAGNIATSTWRFTVDTVPPQIADLSPADGSALSVARPAFSARVADATSCPARRIDLI